MIRPFVPALVVLLAGCSDIGSIDGIMPPSFDLRVDETADRAIVDRPPVRGTGQDPDQDPNWKRNALRRAGCPSGPEEPVVHVGSAGGIVNEPATRGGKALIGSDYGMSCDAVDWTRLADARQAVKQGDFLAFCSNGGVARKVTLLLFDTVANSVLDNVTFSEIRSCV